MLLWIRIAISTALHSVFTLLENMISYIRMLFLDLSSAFSTISPMKSSEKLNTLCLPTTVCSWILDFLTSRPQRVRICSHTSSTLMPNTWARQGYVLSPLPIRMYFTTAFPERQNSIVKCEDETTAINHIVNNKRWCTENNLLISVRKTMELIVDFRKKEAKTHTLSTSVLLRWSRWTVLGMPGPKVSQHNVAL